MQNNSNFIVAIALSIAVLIGWQYFIAAPQQARQQEALRRAQQEQAAQTTTPPAPAQPAGTANAPAGAPAGGTPPATTTPVQTAAPALSRDAALAKSSRVPILTDKVSGSINLTGGRIDDLHLNQFHETVDPSSPTIVLLSPAETADGYYADFGWNSVGGAVKVPDATTVWTAEDGAQLSRSSPVTLTYDNGAGVVFKRVVSIDDNYMFTVADSFQNNTGAPVSLYAGGSLTRNGEPHTSGYAILHEGPIGVFGKGVEEQSYSAIKDAGEKKMGEGKVDKGWLGITDKYWAATLIPEQGKQFDGYFSHSTLAGGAYKARFNGEAITAAPGASAGTKTMLFAGAKHVQLLNDYRDQLGILNFDLLIDWGRLYFITKPMFVALDFFFRLFGNFGIAILLVTVLVKIAFFPLANKSYRSMSAMKKMAPEMNALRERYKDDKVKQQQALMELYKKAKINPVAGCWPMLIQVPVFFALYKVLFITIEMRQAPFFGWIRDLSAPDPTSLFTGFGLLPLLGIHFDPSQVPVVGHYLMLGVWPIIMGITMWVQMRLNPTPPDPTQAMIFNWMPLIFTFMLSSFPAGLVIYWAWNNTLSVTQQVIIMKREGVKVELWDNIRSAFRKKPAAETKPAETKPAKS
jgi:YidC/Oxa1 family membrane protein insertase